MRVRRSIRACGTTAGGRKRSSRSFRVRRGRPLLVGRYAALAWPTDSNLIPFLAADGAFTLLTFQHTPPLPLLTTTSARLAAALLLPFSLTSSHTLGSAGGALHLTLTASSPLTSLVVRIPLANGIEGPGQVQANVSGGAWLRDDEGRSVGGGAGRFEVEEEEVEEELERRQDAEGGKAVLAGGESVDAQRGGERRKRRTRRYVLVWRIDKLGPSDRPAVLAAQYNRCVSEGPSLDRGRETAPITDAHHRPRPLARSLPHARKPPSFTLSFESPTGGFSGLRVDSLKLLNEAYNVYKGVKMVGRGEVEVRT